jgi:hypothetical protein
VSTLILVISLLSRLRNVTPFKKKCFSWYISQTLPRRDQKP